MHRFLLAAAAAALLAGCPSEEPAPSRSSVPIQQFDPARKNPGDGGTAASRAPSPDAGAPNLLVRKRDKPRDVGVCGDHWCWEHPLPQGNALLSVWNGGPKDVWAVGVHGTILRYDGTRWQLFRGGTDAWLNSVRGTGTLRAWAVGSGVALEWDGRLWTRKTIGLSNHPPRVWSSSRDDVWIAGDSVQRFDGSNWSTVLRAGRLTALDIAGTGPRDVWVMARDLGGYLVLAHWDGKDWSNQRFERAASAGSLLALAPDDVWLAAADDLVLHFDGRTWSKVPTAGPGMSVLAGTPRAGVFLAGRAGAIARWDGSGWVPMAGPGGPAIFSMSFADAEDGWAVGESGETLRWDGEKFTPLFEGARGELRAIAGSSPADVWAVGRDGLVLRRKEPGWERVSGMGLEDLAAVWTSAPDDVWVGGDGVLSHWDGAGWKAHWRQDLKPIRALWGSGRADVWAGGAEGLLLHFDGARWEERSGGPLGDARAIAGTGPDDVWVLSEDGDLARWDGKAWSRPPLPQGARAESLSASGAGLYAAGEKGIWRWDGAAFKAVMEEPVWRVWASAQDDVWAFQANGGTLNLIGVRWTRVSMPMEGRVRAVWGAQGEVFALAGGGILHYRP